MEERLILLNDNFGCVTLTFEATSLRYVCFRHKWGFHEHSKQELQLCVESMPDLILLSPRHEPSTLPGNTQTRGEINVRTETRLDFEISKRCLCEWYAQKA